MKIAICGSLSFASEMITIKSKLEALGHTAFVSDKAEDFIGKSEEDKEVMNAKNFYQQDVIRKYWNKIKECDAIVVLNYDKKGIANYIGGNTMMEIGFAHVLYKKIFLLNDIPDIPYYRAEIIGINPTILHNDLSKIC